MNRLKVLTLGAGAIGTYIGGSLSLVGHKVFFVERPNVAREIQSRGLSLTIEGIDHPILEPVVAGSLEEALASQDFDIVIFALKSYHTLPFLKNLPANRSQLPAFLCLSNGVDNEPALAQALGEEKVIAGTVTSAIGRRAVANIILERLRGVGITAGHTLSERLLSAFNEAGLNAQLFGDAAAMKWSKMLTNLLANATSAILDLSPADVFAHPGLFRLEIEMMREALAVMKAQEISVIDLPGTPVRALAFAVRYLPTGISRPLLAKAVGGGRGAKMPSFHIDLYHGRGQSEVDYLNGAVVRAGNDLGISTPVNSLLNETLLNLSNGKLPLDEYRKKPEKLLAQLK